MRKKFSASLVALSFVLTSSLTAVAQDANYSNKNALPEIGVVASDAISLDKEMIVG
ncbi:MAG: M48 family peptidase, partial [Pseudomonadota bacterium]|nr:M48 family peptidase [Pseudomonadota bacterium]